MLYVRGTVLCDWWLVLEGGHSRGKKETPFTKFCLVTVLLVLQFAIILLSKME